ncbi:hypothetical protein O6H91_17G064800 [Diphasiastrum complanatum]|uniref:Uncharacterized protein n=1 Tax=Diphasiastrum complanatum TaxID=34168 RepID=A0ACC2B7R4_DIPCM|nr:hypothetical protein O6H91_17G064800 [Diphasiastrum complanatum]
MMTPPSSKVLCLCFFRQAKAAESLSPDLQPLLAFLQTVKINSPDHILSSWNATDSSPCGWWGVSCSSQNRVTKLSLNGAQLEGSIPPEFGSLDALEHLNLSSTNLTGFIPFELGSCNSLKVLDLSNNDLIGEIPKEIGDLQKLEYLILHTNQLSGIIPPEIGNCISLQILELYDNQLNGTFPVELSRLTSLEVLRAGGNTKLSGSIPPQLSHCKNLTYLGLAITGLSGIIPSSLGELVYLETLTLYGTKLSGPIPPEIGNCTLIQQLSLYRNHLTGSIPPELGKLQRLTMLLLWQNQLTGSIPPELSGCTSLQLLDLSMNYLSGEIPRELGQLQNLHNIYLSQNNLTGHIPSELGNCTSLMQLQLDKNQLTGEIPSQLGHLTQLQILYIWENQLTNSIPSSLGNCSELEVLDLSFNWLTGSIPSQLFHLSKLQRLLLLSNNLSGELPPTIGNCSSLYRLRLNNNMLRGKLPQDLGQLENLNFLDLHSNQLSGVLPSHIGKLRALQKLDIHSNQLSGWLPSDLSQLSSLEILDVSQNNLRGPIPSRIGDMAALCQLNFAQNQLTGSIPASIGNCRKLILLDISSNQLSGDIPMELGWIVSLTIGLNLSKNLLTGVLPVDLASLRNLEALDLSQNRLSGNLKVLGKLGSLYYINVSFNQFTGPLPESRIFKTMAASAFIGNPGLCISSGSDFSCSMNAHSNISGISGTTLIVALLIGVTSILLIVGSVLLYTNRHTSEKSFGSSETPWPWRMTPLQKVTFTVEDVVDSLVESNVVGGGRSGVVYRAEIPGGRTIAVKKIRKRADQSHDGFSAEIDTLGHIRHRNIVRLLGYCSNNDIKLLLYDYMPNGSLGELLHEKKRAIDWETRYKIIVGAAQGLAYLHHDCMPAILHRDIKSHNILLGPRLEPYVADFGLAKLVDTSTDTQPMSKVAGSYGYMAPEYSYSLKITEKSDIYSFGVVLLEILTARRAVQYQNGEDLHIVKWISDTLSSGKRTIELLDSRLKGMPDPFVEEMLQAFGVAMMCVSSLPSDRPSMKEVVTLLLEIKHLPEEVSKSSGIVDKISGRKYLFWGSSTDNSAEKSRFVLSGHSSDESFV